jgi:hypothetical protein
MLYEIDCIGKDAKQQGEVAAALTNFQKAFTPEEIIELSAKLQKPENAKLIRQYKGFLK